MIPDNILVNAVRFEMIRRHKNFEITKEAMEAQLMDIARQYVDYYWIDKAYEITVCEEEVQKFKTTAQTIQTWARRWDREILSDPQFTIYQLSLIHI